LDSIEASQLVQLAEDWLIVRIVPGVGYSEAVSSRLVRELRARLGHDMQIDIELVKTLERTAGGKFKWVVSRVESGL
jgi:phenylacetate-CoA ligase